MSNLRHYDQRRFTKNVMRLESRFTVGQRGAVYEFNVKLSMKLRGVDIDDQGLSIEADDAVGRFAEELRDRYPWVGEVYQTGRSNGWLAIQDRTGGATEADLRAIDEWVDREREIFEDDIIARFGPDAPPASEPPPLSGPVSGVRGVVPPREPKPQAVAFFRDHVGRVGHEDEDARALAIAEQYADDNDWEAVWEEDPEPYETDNEDDRPYEVLTCVLKDADGNVIGSLGGIGMSGNLAADRREGRVIEAQLAAEAMVSDALTPNRRRGLRRNATYQHGSRYAALRTHGKSGAAARAERLQMDVEGLLIGPTSAGNAKRIVESMFRTNTPDQVAAELERALADYQRGSLHGFRVALEGLLIGPTSGGNARHIVDGMFRASSAQEIAEHIRAALGRYGMQRNGSRNRLTRNASKHQTKATDRIRLSDGRTMTLGEALDDRLVTPLERTSYSRTKEDSAGRPLKVFQYVAREVGGEGLYWEIGKTLFESRMGRKISIGS